MDQHRLGGSRWLTQFAHGFPITGHLSQRFVYEADGKEHGRLPRSELFHTAAPRFRERAAKSGMKHDQLLWGESLQQVEKGWLVPPTPLEAGGTPLNWPPPLQY